MIFQHTGLELLVLVAALVQCGARELFVPLPLGPGDQDASALVLPSSVLFPVGILGTGILITFTG